MTLDPADKFLNDRMLTALLIAPFATVVITVVWYLIVGPVNPNDSRLSGSFVIAVVSALYAYLAVLFALPFLYLFRRHDVQKVQWYGMAGGVVGVAYGVAFAGGLPTSSEELIAILFCAVCGLSSAVLFWVIYRPDEPVS